MTELNSTIRRFLTVSAVALALPMSAWAQQAAGSAPAAPAQDARAPMQQRQHGHHGHHGRMDGGMRGDHLFMLRGLDLSSAQKDQAKALFDAQRQAMQDKRQAVREARDALHQLVVSGKYSPERAAELAKDIAQKETAQMLFMAEQGNKLVQILTPEQRTRLQTRMQEKGAAHGGRR